MLLLMHDWLKYAVTQATCADTHSSHISPYISKPLDARLSLTHNTVQKKARRVGEVVEKKAKVVEKQFCSKLMLSFTKAMQS